MRLSCLPWLTHIRDVIHSNVWHSGWVFHGSMCVRETWFIHVYHDSVVYASWLIHTCDTAGACSAGRCVWERHDLFMWTMTHSYTQHDSFTCVTQGVGVTRANVCERDMIHPCVPWLTHLRNVTHSHVWHSGWVLHGSPPNMSEERRCAFAITYVSIVGLFCHKSRALLSQKNTLQHTATHYSTLQHTATHTYVSIVGLFCHKRTHCNTLQCTTAHCNTLRHTLTRVS